MSMTRVRIDPDDPQSLPAGRIDEGVLDRTTEADLVLQQQQDDAEALQDMFITDLREAGYSVLRRIPVEIKRIGPTDYEASFSEANIAMSGTSGQDAYQALVADILDTFDTLSAEQNLGPDAAEQLHILNTYIGRTQGT